MAHLLHLSDVHVPDLRTAWHTIGDVLIIGSIGAAFAGMVVLLMMVVMFGMALWGL